MEVEKEKVQVIKSTCWPGCDAAGCAVELHVKDGKLIKVEGDSDSPDNRGRLCPRILALKQYVYHPHRLRYPMKRVGERGEGKWERISWDEAYDTMVERFNEIKEKYGPEAVAFLVGTARDVYAWTSRLAYSYGSPNWTCADLVGNSCLLPRVAASIVSFGAYLDADFSQFFPDRYENPEWKLPKVIMNWGKNSIYTHSDGLHGYWLLDVLKMGSKLIVVDPRLTWLASKADIWLQLRPGTDGALALGMLNVIINEELYDKEFVEKWCYRFDKLKERVQQYTPEKVADITWVPEERIIEVARLYAKSKPATVLQGQAIDTQIGGVQASIAINAMVAITGNLDVPGGDAIVMVPFGVYQVWLGGWGYTDLLTEEQREKRIGIKEYPLYGYGFLMSQPDLTTDAIFTGRPYPVKAAWLCATNPLACMSGDPRRTYQWLKKLDFIVVVDLFMTPTGMLADIVLPAASTAEKNSINAIWTSVNAIARAIDPVDDCKSDQEIVFELGKRFNPKAWPWKSIEEMLDEIVKPTGLTFRELKERRFIYPPFTYKRYEKGLLRSDGKPGFETPTGKFELYVTMFEKWGYDPLPYYIEPPESPISTPNLYKEYPLILTSGQRSSVFTHSEHRQIPWLRELHPWPLVEIHPDTAKELDVSDGEWVYIETRRGRCKQKAKLTIGIHPKVVHAQHGWWYPEKPGPEPSLFGVWESNINLCVPAFKFGPTGYATPYRSSLCKVYRAERGV